MLPEAELSILLIEDEPDAARLVQYVLSKEGGEGVTVEVAPDLQQGLARLGERAFHAVLVDLNLPDSCGYDTFAQVRQKAVEPAVIVLTGQEDEALALQAVRAGADDYLLKNDTRGRFLAQRVRHAVERNRYKRKNLGAPVRNGKVLSYLSAKGGVGTTTLAINIAAVLAEAGKRVIAIELAPEYSSFSIQLSHASSWDISTLARLAPEMITREAVTSCLEDFGGGVQVLCGAPSGAECGPISAAQALALLGIARTLADYTLVDIPLLSTPASQEMIRHSMLTTLVVERNRNCLQAALGKMPALRAAASHGAVAALINNKTPFSEFLTPLEFGRRLGCDVLGVIPPSPDLNSGVESDPFPVLTRPDSPFSVSIREIARRLSAAPMRFMAA